ncbi:hypothetical protein EU243_08625 [Bacillus velezensis]|nr:hypothetical protein E0E07_14550 [Bacillus velezensis]QOZ91759.1 hypothetical protein EU243_08625 [Bacillus velezensis]
MVKIRDETAVFFQKPAFFFKLIFIAIPLSYVSYALSIHEGVIFLLKTHEFVNILNPKPYPALHKKNAPPSPDRQSRSRIILICNIVNAVKPALYSLLKKGF